MKNLLKSKTEMSKSTKQIFEYVRSHRQPILASRTEDSFELLELGETLKEWAIACSKYPTVPCLVLSSILLRIRESIQSFVLLAHLGLFEDMFSSARKGMEHSIGIIHVIATDTWDDCLHGKGEYERFDFKSVCDRLPSSTGDPIYEFYRVCCKYVHFSNTMAVTTLNEIPLANPAAIQSDLNSREWPSTLLAPMKMMVVNLILGQTALYIFNRNQGITDYAYKVFERQVFRLALKHPKIGAAFAESDPDKTGAIILRFNDLFLHENLITEEGELGSAIFSEMIEEFVSFADSFDPSIVEGVRKMAKEKLKVERKP